MAQTPSLARLIEQLTRLPGIGEKTASRLALHILRAEADYARALASAIVAVKEDTRLCSRCFALTEADPCAICTDPARSGDGICAVDLKIQPLLVRLREQPVREVILATNPTAEGEATALYLARLLKPLGLRVTRIAHGLPVGGDLEYADAMTVGRALEGRREM